jgi:hypothetical protein
MSRFDYEASKRVAASDHPFAVLIVAAMRKADTDKRRGGRCLTPAPQSVPLSYGDR